MDKEPTKVNGDEAMGKAEEGEENFARMFEASLNEQDKREGEIVKGEIIDIRPDHVVVDIGFKSEGTIQIGEFGRKPDGTPDVKVGDRIDVLLERWEDEDGLIVLSKEKADKLKVWDEISDAVEKDQLVKGVIVARVKGGLSVDIGVKAFLPGSQVDLRPIRNLEKLIGQTFDFKIIKFNKRRGNIVLSRRVLLEKEREALKTETLKKLKAGAVLPGIVKNITEYGAFIDLGGIDGLLHITDMSWGRVSHPSQVFSVGDEINVMVLKFDPETERVSLGLKQINEDPWTHADERYPVGNKVKGKVVSLTDYGAFVELEEGIEGLIHISEMSWTKRVKHPSKVVTVGDEVEAIVLDIDSTNKRISLGMKQVEPNPWTTLEEKYPIGSVIRGRIRNITDFGVFIGIEEGIDGLVHISDISWTQRIKHPSQLYKKGDEVEAMVLHIDPENERFSLGIKQLLDDPWTKIPERFPPGTRVKGKVIKVTEFGAFVEIDQGIEGLIHISELSQDRVEDPRSVVNENDTIEVMVLDVDPEERRIALSVKSLQLSKGEEDYQEYLRRQGNASVTLGDALASSGLLPKPEGERGKKAKKTREDTDDTDEEEEE
ncbi:MAG TPA: 30S ribosomal protein S1 [Myxococcota bacterium]|nr:30S ribosomal protein S1 [Myxococcota bacterium]HRY96130.1 30S ribosomal protein S1 [Myxococcota bacterium]